MTKNLKFGSRSKDLAAVSERIAETLEIAFKMRESSYWGGDYYLARPAGAYAGEVRVFRNKDVYERTAIYAEFESSKTLIHCDDVSEGECLKERLVAAGFELLDIT